MDNFWIIGGGKFGLRAAKALIQADASNKLTIVEKEKTVCKQVFHMGFTAICVDGIKYLERNLTGNHFPDWIIPAIPLHTAYEWIRTKLSKTYQVQPIAVPKDIITAVPNPIPAKTGQLFISIADFKCPPSCSEPDDICTHTGKPRPMILHKFLKSIPSKGFKSIVIQSHQLAPGVGGYQPAALFDALSVISELQTPVLLSIACSCHGVMNVFKLIDAKR